MSKTPLMRLVSLLIVGAIVTIGISWFTMTMGAVDNGVSMGGSAYEDEYNSVTDISIISIGLLKFLPICIGVAVLLIGVVGIKKYAGY
jgi:hypothetical protein